MDQAKIGNFLKALRKAQGLTQEQLAEQFNVSTRTVSRWETGSNMPDLSILIELADFYHVDIREIIDGERKGEKMDTETKDTLKKVAEYSDAEKQALTKRMHLLFIVGLIAGIVFFILRVYDCSDNFFGGLCEGIMFGMMGVGVIMTSKNADKIFAYKMRLLHKRG
jgi:transcriptional regulator with XRE-family HTH domain